MNAYKELLKSNIDEELLVKLTKDMVAIESHPLIPCQETGVAEYIKGFLIKRGYPLALMRCRMAAAT